MNTQTIERHTIRQYLLGRLDDDDQIESKISDEIFTNDQFAEMVEFVEQEIIEEYEEGLLDSADRKSAEEYFFQSPERKEELRFSRMLRNHFEAGSKNAARPASAVVQAEPQQNRLSSVLSASRYFWQRVLIYGEAAALIVISAVGITYISGIQKQLSVLQTQVAFERAQSSSLGAELARLRPSVAHLTLAFARSRSNAPLRDVELTPSTQQIAVEIALRERITSTCDVHLETIAGSAPLWSAKLQPIASPSGGSTLRFELPAQSVKAGNYSLVVSPEVAGRRTPRHYDFRVNVTE